jgi:hypothetical protein
LFLVLQEGHVASDKVEIHEIEKHITRLQWELDYQLANPGVAPSAHLEQP